MAVTPWCVLGACLRLSGSVGASRRFDRTLFSNGALTAHPLFLHREVVEVPGLGRGKLVCGLRVEWHGMADVVQHVMFQPSPVVAPGLGYCCATPEGLPGTFLTAL